MSTVDLTKVAGFKAVDSEGNDIGVVSLSEMTNMVKESIIQEAVAMQSVSTLAETSTLAATDTYEDQLPTSDTFSHVRTLDANGNPRLTSSQALATVVGGLINPLSIKGYTTANSDSLTENGIYLMRSNTNGGMPSIEGDGQGCVLIVIKWDNNTIFQLLLGDDNICLFMRRMTSSGRWTDWAQAKFYPIVN